MSYEQNCIDFALHGDPEREHWDHECNSEFDRFDGWGDPDPNDDPGCSTCGYRADCADCVALRADVAEFEAEYAVCADEVPF